MHCSEYVNTPLSRGKKTKWVFCSSRSMNGLIRDRTGTHFLIPYTLLNILTPNAEICPEPANIIAL